MRIAEIFYSLQGEGRNQGRPCLFIRLTGCNLRCQWCDTEYARDSGREMTSDVVLGQVRRKNPKLVCITGGEPLLQMPDLEKILPALSREGVEIDIETNGTINFCSLQEYASICMDVKCPSSGEESDLSLLASIRQEDSVKFVVADEADCGYAVDIIRHHPIEGEIFITPVFGSDYGKIARFILENNLPVRFQIQLHKVIGVQ